MGGDELRQAFEQKLGHLVGGFLRHAVMGDQEIADGCRLDVRGLALIGAGRNGHGEIGRADLRGDVGGHGNDDDRQRGREVADRGDAEAGRLQGRVELAVLDQLDRLGEGQIFDLAEILVFHAGGGEDGAGVELGAGGRRADGQALALEVGKRLDAGLLGGDDLDVVRIDGGDAAQFVELAGKAGLGVAFRRELDGIAERKGDLALALLQEVEVLDRGLGRLHLRAGALDALAIDIGQGNAERIVYAGSAAREHVDELLRLGRNGGEAEREGGGGKQTGCGFQHAFLPGSSHWRREFRRADGKCQPAISYDQRRRAALAGLTSGGREYFEIAAPVDRRAGRATFVRIATTRPQTKGD